MTRTNIKLLPNKRIVALLICHHGRECIQEGQRTYNGSIETSRAFVCDNGQKIVSSLCLCACVPWIILFAFLSSFSWLTARKANSSSSPESSTLNRTHPPMIPTWTSSRRLVLLRRRPASLSFWPHRANLGAPFNFPHIRAANALIATQQEQHRPVLTM